MKRINSGSGIIEVIVGLAIVLVGIFAILRAYDYYIKFALSHKYDVQAALLAEEGIEAVKLLRDTGWTAEIAPLTVGSRYGLAFVNSVWTSTTTIRYVDAKFERSFVLGDVYRGADDGIASSGILDANSKKVTVSVSVRNIFGTTTKTVSTYITNIFAN